MIIQPPDHHQPRNEECPHNLDPSLACNCKLMRNRKPYKVCKVHDAHAKGRLSPDIILEIHPNGVLVFREKGRRTSFETTAGAVFAGLVWKDAMSKAQAKKQSRKRK